MRFSDIENKHLYYVNFNVVRGCEFKDNHLVVVLKKNKDNDTMIVMPLTSSSNGVGVSTELLPVIDSLPDRLKEKRSYAIYNQVRTVNCTRFQPIFEQTSGKTIVEVTLDNEVFTHLIEIGTNELEKTLKLEEKMLLAKNKLNKLATEKIINLAYQIKKENSDSEIERIGTEIKDIIYNNIEYTFTDIEQENGIDKIINKLLNV